ncbi:hypothetical protein EDF62_0818 [Leucobacter luti]|uniref:Lipid/polyisoprenoid-binding YceI-like domain-containing protein n=1 Tax=Leucobacter luti TaxID=340320 RepID=A0A4R6S505_9MICO|nr:hypothetical protein [Leucobacter luti]TDP94403.1 hypothetical protein EDF62_0818 [Leucobacter luti]
MTAFPTHRSFASRTVANRAVRTIGFAAAVTASIPLCLTGCAPIADASVFAAELQASPDSDLLQLPEERVYDVAETSLISPVGGFLGRAVDTQLQSSGFLVLKDGVITNAQIGLSLAEFPEATFELTQPTVLRRAGSSASTVLAIGTISVNGVERPGIKVQLTPTELSEDAVEFDVEFTIPDNPFLATERMPIDEVTAHVVLSAR